VTASTSQRTLLVVEDDAGVARLVQKRLAHHGVHVECVSSGRDAIAWLREKHADLLVLDFMLPDTNAQQLLDSLTEIQPSHVIVMTGRGDEQTAVSMLRLGVFDYVVKSGQFLDDLELSIRRAMAHLAVEEQLRKKSDDLEAVTARLRVAEKFEAVGRLAAGIAHDFNNFLTVVHNRAEELERHPALGPDGREAVADILAVARRVNALTRQLLAFDHRQAAGTTPSPGCSIHETLRTLEPLLGELGGRYRVVLSLADGASAIPLATSELERIVMNLVANARDAMPDGGTIEIRTARRQLSTPASAIGLCPGDYELLEVEDHGLGMDSATKARIFDPFFTTKTTGSGSGLGLTSVYSIVRRCGGAIEVESDPGRGCLIRVYLPATDATSEVGDARDADSKQILLVDDLDSVRRVLARCLTQLGYTVRDVGSGAEALQLVRSSAFVPALVVSDIAMPGMNGVELANELRRTTPGLPVVFISGEYVAATPEMISPEAWSMFVAKPCSASTLASAIESGLRACQS
jgi:two-component system, cell cycle sensor histidine kinase and response regulator CckA